MLNPAKQALNAWIAGAITQRLQRDKMMSLFKAQRLTQDVVTFTSLKSLAPSPYQQVVQHELRRGRIDTEIHMPRTLTEVTQRFLEENPSPWIASKPH